MNPRRILSALLCLVASAAVLALSPLARVKSADVLAAERAGAA